MMYIQWILKTEEKINTHTRPTQEAKENNDKDSNNNINNND